MKKSIEKSGNEKFFAQERGVFLCTLGVNIGWEQDGESEQHERPILIIKKFNSKMVWGLTTKQKKFDFYHNYTDPHGKKVAAIIAQLRLISTKRLIRKLYVMDEEEFEKVKAHTRQFL